MRCTACIVKFFMSEIFHSSADNSPAPSPPLSKSGRISRASSGRSSTAETRQVLDEEVAPTTSHEVQEIRNRKICQTLQCRGKRRKTYRVCARCSKSICLQCTIRTEYMCIECDNIVWYRIFILRYYELQHCVFSCLSRFRLKFSRHVWSPLNSLYFWNTFPNSKCNSMACGGHFFKSFKLPNLWRVLEGFLFS